MAGIAERVFGVDTLVKPEKQLGTMPTTKETYRQFARLAGPSVAEMVLSSLISSVDTMMVGALGPAAIAAVGLINQPWFILWSPVFGINVGLTAVVARRRGEGRQEDASATLRIVLCAVLLLTVLLTAVGIRFRYWMMGLAGAKTDTIDLAASYFRIRLYAFPINALTLCINAAQRGIGNTRITMVTNLSSNLVNIVFNYMLIGGHFGCPALGTDGAAWATDIGVLVGLVLAVLATAKPSSYLSMKPKKSDLAQIGGILRPVAKVSGNAMLEQICIRAGFLMFSRMVADLGTTAYAAHQIAMQFLNLSYCMADGLGVAGTSLVGVNLGRRRPDLASLFGKAAQRVCIVSGIGIALLLSLLKYPLIRLFTDDTAAIQMTENIMYVVALFQPFQMPGICTMGCLRGAGDTKFVARVMLLCITVIRPGCCALAIYVLRWGIVGAWVGSLVDMVTRTILAAVRFRRGKWQKIKV